MDVTKQYSINKPNNWPVNTIIDFGNGLYGKRISGNSNGTRYDQSYYHTISLGIISTSSIIDYGGSLNLDGTLYYPNSLISMSNSSRPIFGGGIYQKNYNAVVSSSSELIYNIWVLYKV